MVYICANSETICSGHTNERTSAWEEQIANEAVEAAYRALVAGGVDPSQIRCSSIFSDWHGGKLSHQQKMHGLTGGMVVYPADANAAVIDACQAAETAFYEAIESTVSHYELRADAWSDS